MSAHGSECNFFSIECLLFFLKKNTNVKVLPLKIQEEHSYITLPNHTRISVTHVGDVSIGLNLTLQDVLFVPEFKFNLLSVSTLLSSTDFPVSF